jgi:hypothetical protein
MERKYKPSFGPLLARELGAVDDTIEKKEAQLEAACSGETKSEVRRQLKAMQQLLDAVYSSDSARIRASQRRFTPSATRMLPSSQFWRCISSAVVVMIQSLTLRLILLRILKLSLLPRAWTRTSTLSNPHFVSAVANYCLMRHSFRFSRKERN